MSQDIKTATTGKAATDLPQKTDTVGKARSTRVQSKDRDMGSALRSVYQHTVEEAIPADLLDLLGKLG